MLDLELYLCLLLVLPVAAAVVAHGKGRSPIAWFFIALVSQAIGFFIVLGIASRVRSCPRCDAVLPTRASLCPECGKRLRTIATDSMAPATRPCPSCSAPYDLDEYDPNAERIFCTTCHNELPRATEAPAA